MDEFAVLAGAVLSGEANVALLWWDSCVMDELAIWFLALNTIVAVLWLVTSTTSWWLAFMAELAILAGAVFTVVADLLTAWWSGWAIVTELAVITGAVLTSEALTDTSTTGWSSWCLAFVAELAILAGAVLAVIAHLLTSWWAWATLAGLVAELAILAGAVLAIVADLLGSTETTTETTAASWFLTSTFGLWAV